MKVTFEEAKIREAKLKLSDLKPGDFYEEINGSGSGFVISGNKDELIAMQLKTGIGPFSSTFEEGGSFENTCSPPPRRNQDHLGGRVMLKSEVTLSEPKFELCLRNLEPGQMFQFVEKQGQIKFGLRVEGPRSATGVVYFYDTYARPKFVPIEPHADDLVELIEGPDNFVTLISTPD